MLQLTEAAPSRAARRDDAGSGGAALAAHLQPREKRSGLLDNANYDKRLFKELRPCASRSPRDEEVPPYVVFNDATLVEMAQLMPMTEDEMLAINGVGHRKLERFGEAFMDLIIEYCRR